MVVTFNEDKKREFNSFNKKSIKLRYGDFDSDDLEIVNVYDDQGNFLLDAEIYFPQDKAYIILNRVHFRNISKDEQIEVLELFFGYLLCPSNLNYVTSAIYVNILGLNIAEDDAQEIGFFPIMGANIFALLNWSFEDILNDQDVSGEIKDAIILDYSKLKAKKLANMDTIRTQLIKARNDLQFFLTSNPQGIMVEMKEIEIKHLERILRLGEDKK